MIAAATSLVAGVNDLLRPARGVAALIADTGLVEQVRTRTETIGTSIAAMDADLDRERRVSAGELEAFNSALVALKDAVWSIERDRLRAAESVSALAGPDTSAAGLDALFSLHQALSAIDRLEVRGRDSAVSRWCCIVTGSICRRHRGPLT